jgi:hypothetical protein
MNSTRAKELLPVITAFANGEDIEIKDVGSGWLPTYDPTFSESFIYRIAPKPKTCERWCFAMFLNGSIFWYSSDSETGAIVKKKAGAFENPKATFSAIHRMVFVEQFDGTI